MKVLIRGLDLTMGGVLLPLGVVLVLERGLRATLVARVP